MQRPLKIGTRGSPLALYQARLVQSRLAAAVGASGDQVEARFPVCIFTTSGDKLKGKLSEFGGKGLFTKELETALLDGDIDLAVHSMKDVPTIGQDGLIIGAVLEREDHRDAFISFTSKSIEALPQGARVGTASLRRRAQLAHMRPDIEFVLLRGNVGTRLEKLKRGDCDATFLACAGLNRLGQSDVITQTVSTDKMLNAPAQGAIGIECREGDEEARNIIGALNHARTQLCVMTERAFLRAMDGSCRTPIAAYAQLGIDCMRLKGEVYSISGDEKFSREKTMPMREGHITDDVIQRAVQYGMALGKAIKQDIGDRDIWRE